MAEQAHHPPAAGGCLYVRIVIEHDMVIIADAKRGDAFGEEVGRGDHMRHGVALVGNGVNVEPPCPGDMSREEFGAGVAFHRRQMAAGVKDAHPVDVVEQPFGGNEDRRHVYSSSQDGTGRFFSRRKAGFHTFD